MSVTHRMESQRGRIGRKLNSGLDKDNVPWANFSLAVDVNRRNEQGNWEKVRTEWYQVSAFKSLAKNVSESFGPGSPVVVTGDVTEAHRVVEGDDGAPVVQTRKEVRADMIAPDMILTPVVIPEKPAYAGPSQAGPGTAGPEGTASGPSAFPNRMPSSSGTGVPSPAAGTEQAGPASPLGGDATIWPEAVQPGSGAVGPR